VIFRPGQLRALVIVALAATIPVAPATLAIEVPYLSGRVVDQAAILQPETVAALEARLADLERESGAQVVVLTIPTLDDADLEATAHEIAQTWQLGRAKEDDGVLVLVALAERAVRIEVGYGLEAALPDALAGRIIDTVLVPAFRTGAYDEGLLEGVAEIERAVRREPSAMPAEGVATDLPLPARFGIVAVFILPFLWPAVALRGFPGCFVVFFMTFFVALLASVFLGPAVTKPAVVGWLLVVLAGRLLLPEGLKMTASSSGGGRGSSYGGGGGSGGGGFSGGGGSFGGGGASGRW
jgi:uncharacterized protein